MYIIYYIILYCPSNMPARKGHVRNVAKLWANIWRCSCCVRSWTEHCDDLERIRVNKNEKRKNEKTVGCVLKKYICLIRCGNFSFLGRWNSVFGTMEWVSRDGCDDDTPVWLESSDWRKTPPQWSSIDHLFITSSLLGSVWIWLIIKMHIRIWVQYKPIADHDQ